MSVASISDLFQGLQVYARELDEHVQVCRRLEVNPDILIKGETHEDGKYRFCLHYVCLYVYLSVRLTRSHVLTLSLSHSLTLSLSHSLTLTLSHSLTLSPLHQPVFASLTTDVEQTCVSLAKTKSKTLDRMPLADIVPCMNALAHMYDAHTTAMEEQLAEYGFVSLDEAQQQALECTMLEDDEKCESQQGQDENAAELDASHALVDIDGNHDEQQDGVDVNANMDAVVDSADSQQSPQEEQQEPMNESDIVAAAFAAAGVETSIDLPTPTMKMQKQAAPVPAAQVSSSNNDVNDSATMMPPPMARNAHENQPGMTTPNTHDVTPEFLSPPRTAVAASKRHHTKQHIPGAATQMPNQAELDLLRTPTLGDIGLSAYAGGSTSAHNTSLPPSSLGSLSMYGNVQTPAQETDCRQRISFDDATNELNLSEAHHESNASLHFDHVSPIQENKQVDLSTNSDAADYFVQSASKNRQCAAAIGRVPITPAEETKTINMQSSVPQPVAAKAIAEASSMQMNGLPAFIQAQLKLDDMNNAIRQINTYMTDNTESFEFLTQELVDKEVGLGSRAKLVILALMKLKRLVAKYRDGKNVYTVC
jgi:hypothetical protein